MAARHLTTLVALLAAPLHVYADAGVADVPLPPGFSKVLFYDDFSNSSLDLSKWQYDLGTQYPGGPANWGTGEIQSYTDSPINSFITNNKTFRIVPVNDAAGWTSARVQTTPDWDFGADVGQLIRVEARLKFGLNSDDLQQGIWPAFWSLGAPYRGNYNNWPLIGEIDFFETANGQNKGWQTLHCGSSLTGGPCNEPTGLSKQADDDIYDRDQWTLISWEMDRRRGASWSDPANGAEESMTWFINDKPVYTIHQSDINDDSAWSQLVENKKFLILDVAVGGGFPNAKAGFGTPTEQTLGGDGAAMEVDYVGVYQA